MTSKRERLAQVLHRSGGLRALLALRARRTSPWLSVLTYHRFPSLDGVERFDDGVVDTTTEEFDQHVASLKRYFTIIGADELHAFARGAALPPNPVAITFDDGYRDCYTQAFPILKRHHTKAIFFVATGILSQRKPYWWDRVAYLLKQSRRERLTLTYPKPLDIPLGVERATTVNRLLRLVKQQQLAQPFELERFLDDLAHAAGVPWTQDMERAFADELLMTWDQVRAMRQAGMDIQSHTRSHRVLQTLSRGELSDELAGSRQDLARELGELPSLIAYPGGNPLTASSPIRGALEQAGYRLGFNNVTGSTPLHRALDPFNMRRFALGRNFSESLLLSVLALPRLAHTHPWQ